MKHYIRALLLSLLLSGLGLAWIIYRVGSAKALTTVLELPLKYWLLALTAQGVSIGIAACRLQIINRLLGGRLGYFQALHVQILAIFSAAVTPGGSGNGPAIALGFQHHGLKSSQAWAAALFAFSADVNFFAYGMPLALLCLVSSGLFPSSSSWRLLSVLAVILSLGLAYLLSHQVHRLHGILAFVLRGPFKRWRQAGLDFVAKMLESNELFAKAEVLWHLGVQGLTFSAWLSGFSVLYFLALGLGITIGALAVLAFQMLIVVISTFVPTPGGSGFFELAMAYLLLGRGNDTADISQVW